MEAALRRSIGVSVSQRQATRNKYKIIEVCTKRTSQPKTAKRKNSAVCQQEISQKTKLQAT